MSLHTQAGAYEHDELFVVLGFLEEYLGRWIDLEGDCVERFYGNEEAAAALFEQWLWRLREKMSLADVVRREGAETGIYFRSRGFKELINAQYLLIKPTGFLSTDAQGSASGDLMAAFITPAVFEQRDRRTKLSYLAGAHARYGDGPRFIFANAKHKAEVVLSLLHGLGCDNVGLELTNPGYVPNRWEVRFTPTMELRERLLISSSGLAQW